MTASFHSGVHAAVAGENSFVRPSARHVSRAVALKWLRQVHGWIGLWGAALGLLFGVTGILMNHRATLKIPAAQVQETTLQLPLPQPAPRDAHELATWLQHELAIDHPANRVHSEQPKPVPWGQQHLLQPAHWSVVFSSPRVNWQAEYWLGNSFVSVRRSDNNVFAGLNHLHKGTGASIGWILLADTLAGSIILLALTGISLWVLMNRRRLIGAGIALVSLAMALTFAMGEV